MAGQEVDLTGPQRNKSGSRDQGNEDYFSRVAQSRRSHRAAEMRIQAAPSAVSVLLDKIPAIRR